jgi:lauroyl/myristoyl acyltransferase
MLLPERPSARRRPLWAEALRLLPSAKFAATETALRTATADPVRAEDLTTENLEFTWRYYGRLARLLSPNYRRRLRRRTRVVGCYRLSRALESGAGAVLVSAHLGELEAAASWLTGVAGREVVAVVDSVSPWARQLFFDRVRRACGVRLRRQAEVQVEDLVADLAAGRIVLLMLDRHCRSRTVPASFMGRRVDLPAAAWELSVRAGAPVLTGATVRPADGGCVLRFGAPREAGNNRHLDPDDLIQALATELESEIRQAPSQWHIPADPAHLPTLAGSPAGRANEVGQPNRALRPQPVARIEAMSSRPFSALEVR